MSSSLLEAALGYLDRGWSVVPCAPRGKKPLIEWLEFSRRLPTRQEIKQWWTMWPDANIAIVCGKVSGIVVVDVDVDRGAEPNEVLQSGPTSYVAKTGSGGFHFYYGYPKDREHVGNRVGSDGVDVRADGGYVIVPPSGHKSGNLYQWIKQDKLGKLPEWVLQQKQATPDSTDDSWLVSTLKGLGRGERNNACARLAGYYAKKQIPMDVALETIRAWNNKNNPPLPDHELVTTTQSVFRTALSKKKLNGTHKSSVPGATGAFSFMPMNAYMSQFGGVEPKWIIENWFPSETIGFIVSPPGTFKTWTILDLAVSVAGGYPFLGQFDVLDPGPVMIIQQEDYHGQIAERLGTIQAVRDSTLPTAQRDQDDDSFEFDLRRRLPIYIHPDRSLRFDNPEIVAALGDQIDRLRPKLCIIDPLYSAASTDDYMAKAAGQMFALKEFRDNFGCAFLIAHHTKKRSEGAEREDLWGSQFLNAFLETGWQIRPEDETTVTVKRHFKVKQDPVKLRLQFDIQTYFPAHYRIDVTEHKDPADATLDIKRVLQDEALTAAEIMERTGISRATVYRVLKKLQKVGDVRRQRDGKIVLDGLPRF